MTKVLLITNIPTPYRIPLFNEINKQLGELGIGFKVLFGARGYARRKWVIDEKEFEFEYQFLPSKNLFEGHEERSSFTYTGLYKIINHENPDVTITSGFSIATTKLWLRSFFKDTPYLIWSGAIDNKDHLPLGSLQRKILIKRANGFIAYGTVAKEYLVKMGAPENKISIGINTVETKYFSLKAKDFLSQHPEYRESKHLLYVGNLTKGKRLDLLLVAINQLKEFRQDFQVDIVGTGPEKDVLEQYCKEKKIEKFVNFVGYKQRDELIPFLANSICFLFPSEYDIWGLVLVEAMAAGLPCMSSIKAGATTDIIQNSINGFTINFENTNEVIERLNWVLDHPEIAHQMGMRASQFIRDNLSINKSAKGFVNPIVNTLGKELQPQISYKQIEI